jgi:hypothetical protein
MLERVLGPTADLIGKDIAARYAESRMRATLRIAKAANAKMKPGTEDYFVSPRVAMRVLDEGSLADGAVTAEYFGGILASSRSPDGTDDRGTSWAALVARMASTEIYLHYLIYDAFRRLYLGRANDSDLNLGDESVAKRCWVYLPASQLLPALGLEPSGDEWHRVVAPALDVLTREGLVGPVIGGSLELVRRAGSPRIPQSGLLTTPSGAGLRLFLWAHGFGALPINEVTNPDLTFDPVEDLRRVAAVARLEQIEAGEWEQIWADAEADVN